MIRPSLQAESDKLARSWMQHDARMLRGYLVAGVEDPRLNVQSVLSRHFLARAVTAERYSALMEAECRFAAAMNWLTALAGRVGNAGELESVLYALRRGADNAEGVEIPSYILQTFAALPTTACELMIPNYIESFLSGTQLVSGRAKLHEPNLNTFRDLWCKALAAGGSRASGISDSAVPYAAYGRSVASARTPGQGAASPAGVGGGATLSVVEPACGSANDYRFLDAYGLARLLDYAGFDICAKNIENARALFPGVSFAVGNVFEIALADKSYDLCFVHDLFEHLSVEGVQAAVKEVCRVTRRGLCVGFFNMDEIRDHAERPVDDYHWNLLSMGRMKELFAGCGFAAQVVNIGTFLRQQIGCEQTHNPNAYTFFLRPA